MTILAIGILLLIHSINQKLMALLSCSSDNIRATENCNWFEKYIIPTLYKTIDDVSLSEINLHFDTILHFIN